MSRGCFPLESLQGLIDGHLGEPDASEVVNHVESCTRCQADLERLTSVDDLLPASAPDDAGAPDSRLAETVLARLTEGALGSRGLRGPSLETEPIGRGAAPASSTWPAIPSYEPLEVLGRGGMGVVYKARYRSLNRLVALKMIRAGEHATPEQIIRFRVEGETLASLRHPNIVQIHEFGTHEGLQYAALEFVEGGTLEQRLVLSGGGLSAGQAAWLVETLARATHYAHLQGIVHRDLKPANILLAPRSEGDSNPDLSGSSGPSDLPGWTPKISDFGLAKQIGTELKLTQSGVLAGTPAYMAPEQIRGGGDRIGPRTDVYGLGAILFEILTGRPPFEGSTAAEVVQHVLHRDPSTPARSRSGVPRDLETICLRCLEKEPDRRYASALELAEDLLRFRSGRPILARSIGPAERLSKWARRHPAVAMLSLAVAASLLIGTASSIAFAVQANRRADEALLARRDADEALGRSIAARRESDRLAASLLVRSGIERAEQGKVASGLFTLLDAWEKLPPEDIDDRHAIRANLAAWSRELPTLISLTTWGEPDRRGRWLVDGPGETVVSIEEGTIRRWDGRTGRPLGPAVSLPDPLRHWPYASPEAARLADPGDARKRPVLSADGSMLALWLDGRCHLIDTASGRVAAGPLTDPYMPHRFAADDRILVTMPFEQPELERAKNHWSLDGETPERPAFSIKWTPGEETEPWEYPDLTDDGLLISAVNRDGLSASAALEFWDTETGRRVEVPSRLRSTNPRFLWADGLGLTVFHGLRSWDTTHGRLLGEPWVPRNHDLVGVTRDGQTTFGAGPDRRFRLFDVDRGLQRGGDIVLSDADDGPGPVVERPDEDGGLVRVFADDGTIREWRPGASMLESLVASPWSRPLSRPIEAPNFSQAVFDPSRRAAALCDTDRDFGLLVDTATGRPIGPPLRSRVALPTFSPDGSKVASVASARHDGRAPWLHLRDVSTGEECVPPISLPRLVYALAFSPDGQTLAVGCVGMTLLVDAREGLIRHRLLEQTTAALLAFSPDGRRLAVAYQPGWRGVGGGLRLWNVDDGQPIGPFLPWAPGRENDEIGAPLLLAFASQGRRVLVVLPDHLRIYDGETGEPIDDPLPLGNVSVAALNADRTRLAIGSGGEGVQQWDLATRSRVGPPMDPGSVATRLRYSPDGRTLAVAYRDGSVRLWDRATGTPIGPAWRGRSPVSGLEFSEDGEALVIVAAAGVVRVRALPPPVADAPGRMGLWLRVASGVAPVDDRLGLLDEPSWRRLREEWLAEATLADAPYSDPPPLGFETTRYDARAQDAEAAGNWHAALWHLERLAALRPDDWFPLARRCRVFLALGDHEAARRSFQEAVRIASEGLGPSPFDWAMQQEATAMALERWPEALTLQDLLIDTGADDWLLHADRARALAATGRHEEVATEEDRAVALGADRAYLLELAERRAEAESWASASDLLDRASARGSPDLMTDYTLALASIAVGDLGRYQRACSRQLDALPPIGPDLDPGLANNVAMLCALAPGGVEDWTLPIALTDHALGGPDGPDPDPLPDARLHARLNTRGFVLYRAGRSEESVACLRRALEFHPEGGEFHDWVFLAMALRETGQVEAARSMLDRARTASESGRRPSCWEQLETAIFLQEASGLIQTGTILMEGARQ